LTLKVLFQVISEMLVSAKLVSLWSEIQFSFGSCDCIYTTLPVNLS